MYVKNAVVDATAKGPAATAGPFVTGAVLRA
jgi:hypothetical protein